jgi:hypothetical protein
LNTRSVIGVIDRLRSEIDKIRTERPFAERSDFHQPWQRVSG